MLTPQEFLAAIHEWVGVSTRRSMHDFKLFMAGSGLSPSQAQTLMRLYYGGGCAVNDLAAHLGLTLGAASQLIDRLLGMGLVTRGETPGDRRVRQVELSEAGRQLVKDSITARERWMEGLTGALSAAERETIAAALRTLTAAALRLEGAPAEAHPCRHQGDSVEPKTK